MLATGLWMFAFYSLWKLSVVFDMSEPERALILIAGFAPIALWSVLDYRMGLVLTVLALPFFDIPGLPKLPLQGLGSMVAATTCLGFLFRHPNPRSWLDHFDPAFWWVVALMGSIVLSLLAMPPLPENAKFDINYGIAEFLGIGVVGGYAALLASHLRSKNDLGRVMLAVGITVVVVLFYGFLGLAAVSGCSGGFVSRTVLTHAQRPIATFGGPNAMSSYLLSIVPLALYLQHLRDKCRWLTILATLGILGTALLIDFSQSRTGLLTLFVVWLAWVVATRGAPGRRTLALALGAMMPLALAIWYYPACSCSDAPPIACKITYLAELRKFEIVGFWQMFLLAHESVNELSLGDRIEVLSYRGFRDQIRAELAQTALRLWQSSPWTGVGAGMMPNYTPAHQQAHNVVLSTLAQQGALGVIALAGWWLTIARRLWQGRRLAPPERAAVGYVALAFVVVSIVALFHDQMRMLEVWIVFAVALAVPRVMSRSGAGETTVTAQAG